MADQSATPKPRKRRRGLRRFLVGLLIFLGTIVVFHRPLIHYGGRHLAIWLAKRENVNLDLQIRGNVWDRLEIHNLKATADGTGPAPIEYANVDRAVLEYDLSKLLKRDWTGLHLIDIGKMDAVITPQPKIAPDKIKPSIAQQMREILQRPLPATQVRIGRADLRIKDPEEPNKEIVVQGLKAQIEPGKEGTINWERVEIPGLPPLEASQASTETAKSQLLVGEVALWPELRVKSVQIQPTQPGQPAAIKIEADVAGGVLSGTIQPQPAGNELAATFKLETPGAARLAQRFGIELPAPVDSIAIEGTWEGDPKMLEQSRANVTFSARGPGKQPIPQWTVSGKAVLDRGKLDLSELQGGAADATITGNGTLNIGPLLARKGAGRAPIPEGTIHFRIDSPDLAKTAAHFKKAARGTAQVNGSATLAGNTVAFDVSIDGREVHYESVTVGALGARITGRMPVDRAPPLPGIRAEFTVNADGVSHPDAQVDRVRFTGSLAQLQVTARELIVVRGRNELRAQGAARLTPEGKFAESPAIRFSIEAPALVEFGLRVKGAPVAGELRGKGSITVTNGQPTGDVQLTGSNMQIGEADAGGFVLEATFSSGIAELRSFRAEFNETDRMDASGRVDLKSPHAYTGKMGLNVRELAEFQPILEVLGMKLKLGGSLAVDWSGSGDRSKHQGNGRLTGRATRFDNTVLSEVRLTADYTPARVQVPEFLIVAEQLRATGTMNWAQKRLRVTDLEMLLAGREVVSGELSTPFDPFAKSMLPGDQPIAAEFAARNLDLGRIFQELKLKAPLEGTLNATLSAKGTLDAPTIRLEANGRSMRLPIREDADLTDQQRAVYSSVRGDFDATATFERDELNVDATVRNPDFRPLRLSAEAPLKLKPILEGKIPDWKNATFTATADLPTSSLAVVPKLVPSIARIDGTIAIAARVTGTVSNPELSGTVTSDVRSLRMANTSIPPVGNVALRLRLAGNTVHVDRLRGETGGGNFAVNGTVVAANLLEPVVDLTLKTDKVLAVRNDSVLVRIDADVALRGAINAGVASGRVVLAQSRFNKEIQILPILMPGRPKPVPREVSQPVIIAFPNPPLRDWKFDIAIVTTNEDPFLVRGNLAKGRINVDVRLLGTGASPYLVGAATLDQFRAQLPVSTLTTRRGGLYFSEENPFEPRIELETETVIRGYTIIARLEGSASAPRLDLSSEPPLPQQEIMSLLTTGSMSGELGENNSALATRAGLIVLREWYRKIFKRDLPVPTDTGGDNFFGRFNVDLGAVDSRTGRQEVTAQFRVTDQVILVGDIEMGRGISGRIQYVFRFR